MGGRDWWAERKTVGLRGLRAHDFPGFDGDTELLLRGLQDTERRRTAAQWLGELGETRAIPPLLRLLDAHDPFARIAGARALGTLKAQEAVERLTDVATTDDELFVRCWAAEALGRIGDPSSIPVLLSLLADDDWRTRMSAIYALGLIRDPATLDAVRRARRKDRWSWRYLLMRSAYRHTVRVLKGARSPWRFCRGTFPHAGAAEGVALTTARADDEAHEGHPLSAASLWTVVRYAEDAEGRVDDAKAVTSFCEEARARDEAGRRNHTEKDAAVRYEVVESEASGAFPADEEPPWVPDLERLRRRGYETPE